MRVPRGIDFQRMYKGRTAVERVNARLKIFRGGEDGNIVGARRFHAFVGVVMAVHLAFATLLAGTADGPRRRRPDPTFLAKTTPRVPNPGLSRRLPAPPPSPPHSHPVAFTPTTQAAPL